jgi:hypothetical protein
MPTDPGPLLSTIAGASSALVAIVGGLLVARFVTLDSEQQGAQRVLEDAEARLALARQRAQQAAGDLLRWGVRHFLYSREVLTAINEGVEDLAELRKVGDSTRLTDEELQPFVDEVGRELAQAHEILEHAIPNPVDPKYVPYGGWEVFRRDTAGLPETNWDLAWEIVFDQIVERRPFKRMAVRDRFTPSMLALAGAGAPRTDWQAIRARRLDDLEADKERTAHQAEDLEGEVQRLRLARDAIVRPQGLTLGLVILGYFTAVGVVLPIGVIGLGPTYLGRTARMWLLAGFLTGLLALFVYMAVYALRLSRRAAKPTRR